MAQKPINQYPLAFGPLRPTNGYRTVPAGQVPSVDIYGTTDHPAAPSSAFFFTDHPRVGGVIPAHVGGSSHLDIRTLPVSQQQTLLAHAGYHVTVDGITGPQTQTALKAYLSGVPAAKWNHAWASDVAAKPHTDAQLSAYGASGGGTVPTTRQPQSTPPPQADPNKTIFDQVAAALASYAPMTPAAMQAAANTAAHNSLAPQLAANAAARQQAAQQYQQALALAGMQSQQAQAQAQSDAAWQAKQQAGIAAGLAGVLKGVGPATEQAYSNATADTKALAGGFSDTLRQGAQTSADQTNQFLQSIGAPAGQMLNPAVGVGGGDVAYGLGGALPGAALAREGAAAATAANQLPATAAGMGRLAANDALAQGVANRQDLRNGLLTTQQQLRSGLLDQQAGLRGDFSTIQAGRPALVQSALANLQDQDAKSAANAQNAALLPLVLGERFTNLEKTQADIKRANTPTRPTFDASASRALGYRADQFGNPMTRRLQLLPGFAINNQGQVVKDASAKKAKAMSFADRQKWSTAADDMAYLMKNGGESRHGDQLPAVDYNQAIVEFKKQGFFETQPLRAIAMSAIWNYFGPPPSSIVVDHSRPTTTG